MTKPFTAEDIAKALGARQRGDGWRAKCPAHDDQNPSFDIDVGENGTVLVYCHAGCDQRDIITALKDRGLWDGKPPHLPHHPRHGPVAKDHHDQKQAARRAAALAIWKSTIPANGTLVEIYLAARGLNLPIPPAVRFHRGLKHPAGSIWPVMVALVTRGSDDTPIAIHRTFLARDGSGKAPVEPAKMMLGPCRGGAVRLGDAGDVLMVGEGIETCLAAMLATGNPAWAALSTSGMRTLDLPGLVREVIVLADGDDAGEAAARDCALRWKRQGRRVRIARPPQGMDFNDVLLGRAPRTEEGAQ